MNADDFGRVVVAAALIAYVLQIFVWGAICGYVAREKSRREGWWTFFGYLGGLVVFGGLMAYLAIAAVPDLSEYEPSEPSPRTRKRRPYGQPE
ncbi:MAG: hypothetical protein IT301_06280 [Dehalococcoidia bacterium]|nr:hypothetical protein [Dehalococcoidia bacterium]